MRLIPAKIFSPLFLFSLFCAVGCGGGSQGASSAPATVLVANAGGTYSGMVGMAIQFNGSPIAPPLHQFFTYSWSFGDGTTGTGVSPSHTYTRPGTYTVSLTVTDAGLSGSATTTATVAAAPPVAKAGGPYSGAVGTAVNFSANGSTDPQGQALSYAWSFGDGTKGTGASPSHTYAAGGTYLVSLDVTNTSNLTSAAATTAVVTSQAPMANAGGPYTGLPNAPVTFSGSGSSDPRDETLTYVWNFGDGSMGTGVNPNHSYTNAGNYTVSLTVTDTSNLSSMATATAAIYTTGPALSGTVNGGGQAVSGAHLYLLAVNTTGHGNGSLSLLDSTGHEDSIGWYILTNSSGGFAIPAGYNCPVGSQLYFYASGGSIGGVANSALSLLASAGTCGNSGAGFMVNEVTTVAMAYALSGFASDATHFSSSGTTLARTDVANSFANFNSLVNPTTGAALATTPNGNGTVSVATINTLANILAACISSSGPASAACSGLFSNTQSDGATGAMPTDTATAAINLAHHPAANVPALFALQTGGSPFSPALNSVPNDFVVTIIYSTYPLATNAEAGPDAIAIDAYGSAWIGNYNRNVQKLSSRGDYLSPSAGYQGDKLIAAEGIAIDLAGNAWITDWDNYVSELTNSGSPLSGTSPDGLVGGYYSPSLCLSTAIAIDASGNAWVTSTNVSNACTTGGMAKFSSSGTLLSGANGYVGNVQKSNPPQSYGIAIDGSGHVWVTNDNPNYIAEFSNTGTVLSGTAGYASPLAYNQVIAIDGSGNVWAAGSSVSGVSTLVKFSQSGAQIGAYTGGGLTPELVVPAGMAIDGLGNVWVASRPNVVYEGKGNVSEFSNSGSLLSGPNGYTGGGTFPWPTAMAIDGSGDIWVTNFGYCTSSCPKPTVTELIGVAAPVITPLAAALPATPTVDGSSKLGTRP
jgi:PKD repeat protein